MIDQALHAAHIIKAREIVVASVRRLRAAHIDCTDLMDQAEQYLHATRAIDHFHAVYDCDLAFEPSGRRTIADLANLGSALLEFLSPVIAPHTPVEVLFDAICDLCEQRDEATNQPDPSGVAGQEHGRAIRTITYEKQTWAIGKKRRSTTRVVIAEDIANGGSQ